MVMKEIDLSKSELISKQIICEHHVMEFKVLNTSSIYF